MIRKDLIRAGEAILSPPNFGSRSRSFALNQTLDNTHLRNEEGDYVVEEQNSQEEDGVNAIE